MIPSAGVMLRAVFLSWLPERRSPRGNVLALLRRALDLAIHCQDVEAVRVVSSALASLT